MKKLFFSLFVLLLLSTSNIASAACAYMNVHNSGASLAVNGSSDVYGPFSISCLGVVSFTFQDLSGNNPTSTINHLIEKMVGGSWQVVSQTTSYGERSVTRSFFPTATGSYRYRIVNSGQSVVRNWRMEGRIPLFTIPGTR
ncbi:hypothetical protein [Photorhabdus hindustanensis]|uniref:Uncharacterized protein n=1 Tax=Photorhabdus hindustanensis TaxID=2918802 RepID=A0A2S8Q708_9GAMM|nr:hypothetical protein [Photorhabdus hindustanensis]PQQ28561.1 hypothetical protein C6H66_03340 [Photorhabdus hindustanensis]